MNTLPKHIQEAATPLTDSAYWKVKGIAPVAMSISEWAEFARNLERITIWQQEVMEKMTKELQNIKDEHHKTMSEVSDIGHSGGLCLKPSMFLGLLEAQSAYTQLQSYLKTLKGDK